MNKAVAIKDLSELDTVAGADAGHEFELRHPATNEPLGIFMTVVGSDSERYHEHLRQIRKQAAAQATRSRHHRQETDEDDVGIGLLAASTIGWKHMPPVNGKAVEFSLDNAKMVYKRFPWIREQASVVIQERANFLPRSGSGS